MSGKPKLVHVMMNDVHYYLVDWKMPEWMHDCTFYTSGNNFPLFPGRYLMPNGNGTVVVKGMVYGDKPWPRGVIEQHSAGTNYMYRHAWCFYACDTA